MLILVLESKILYFSMWYDKGGTIFSFIVVYVDNIMSKFYVGHLPVRTKFDANIGRVMSLKWSCVR